MSYGQNLPWGLQATRTLGAASWNGQTNPYLIKSGYTNNIFKGDPVVIAGPSDASGNFTGYIISIYDVSSNTFQQQATLGIFQGCSFITPTATNPIDPASPGRQYWPANTATLNGVPGIAYIIDDPDTVFNVQTTLNGSLGAQQSDVGNTFQYSFNLAGGVVQGNTNTGQSQVAAINPDANQRGTDSQTNNLLCVAIVPSPPNPSTPGTQYNNIEVLIMNHQYAQRAPARA